MGFIRGAAVLDSVSLRTEFRNVDLVGLAFNFIVFTIVAGSLAAAWLLR